MRALAQPAGINRNEEIQAGLNMSCLGHTGGIWISIAGEYWHVET